MTIALNSDYGIGETPRSTFFIKRIIDVVGSSIGLMALAPVFVIIALSIRLETPGPVFFMQRRLGRNGTPFWIYKFRTMKHAESGACGSPLTVRGDDRVTRIGALLRKLKLDELPQLMNVLKGEMSLVGPRPESLDLAKCYTRRDASIILSVRPGMTDLASIHFVDENDLLDGQSDPVEFYKQAILPAKVRFYRMYVSNISIAGDLKIIAQTLGLLVSRGPRRAHAVPVRAPLQISSDLAGFVAPALSRLKPGRTPNGER